MHNINNDIRHILRNKMICHISLLMLCYKMIYDISFKNIMICYISVLLMMIHDISLRI